MTEHRPIIVADGLSGLVVSRLRRIYIERLHALLVAYLASMRSA